MAKVAKPVKAKTVEYLLTQNNVYVPDKTGKLEKLVCEQDGEPVPFKVDAKDKALLDVLDANENVKRA